MDRMSYIGGNDAGRIMKKDWLSLYEEKMGITQPHDLSDNFPVQLGIYTEHFHRQWIEDHGGLGLMIAGEWKSHPEHTFIGGTIDAWCTAKNTFIDFKHSNESASPRSQGEQYLPQIAHYCNIHNVNEAYISTIPGNTEPFVTLVEPPLLYRQELLELELKFWFHITNQIAPDIVPKQSIDNTNKLVKQAKIDAMRFVNMEGNNQWADKAATFLGNMKAAKIFETSKTELKAMIEDDVHEAEGHGIRIKRSKGNALLFSIKE